VLPRFKKQLAFLPRPLQVLPSSVHTYGSMLKELFALSLLPKGATDVLRILNLPVRRFQEPAPISDEVRDHLILKKPASLGLKKKGSDEILVRQLEKLGATLHVLGYLLVNLYPKEFSTKQALHKGLLTIIPNTKAAQQALLAPKPALPDWMKPDIKIEEFGLLFKTLFRSALKALDRRFKRGPDAVLVNPVGTFLTECFAPYTTMPSNQKVGVEVIISANLQKLTQKSTEDLVSYYTQRFPTIVSKIVSGLAITSLTDRQEELLHFQNKARQAVAIRSSLRTMGNLFLEFGMVLEKPHPKVDMLDALQRGTLRVSVISAPPHLSSPDPSVVFTLYQVPSRALPPLYAHYTAPHKSRISASDPQDPPPAPNFSSPAKNPKFKLRPLAPALQAKIRLAASKLSAKKQLELRPMIQLDAIAIANQKRHLKPIPHRSTLQPNAVQTPAMFRNIKKMIPIPQPSLTLRSTTNSVWSPGLSSGTTIARRGLPTPKSKLPPILIKQAQITPRPLVKGETGDELRQKLQARRAQMMEDTPVSLNVSFASK